MISSCVELAPAAAGIRTAPSQMPAQTDNARRHRGVGHLERPSLIKADDHEGWVRASKARGEDPVTARLHAGAVRLASFPVVKRVAALLGVGALALLAPASVSASGPISINAALHPAKQSPTFELGDCGREVHRMRSDLAAAGYLGDRARSGQCFDELTQNAVMAFQKWSEIDRDGVVGPQTRAALQTIRRPTPLTGGGGERIEIDISRQVALIVRGHRVLRALSISSGASGYDTPTGEYEVYLQNEDAYSYIYDAPMPWASFFNGGIALHESSDVPGYAASHGCVRVPVGFAERLFRFAEIGTPVIVVS